MTVRVKRWARVAAGLLVSITLFACTNRAADVRPTAMLPDDSPQATRVLPTPIPRLTPLPSPVVLTPTAVSGGATTATVAAPTAVRPTATSRPPAFSMPGAGNAQSTPSVAHPMASSAENVVKQYAASVPGLSLNILSAEKADSVPTLPESVQSYVNDTGGIGETYTAELPDGWAMVGFAEKLAGDDDLSMLTNRASLGVFVFQRAKPMPGNESAALAVVQATFPGLTNIPLQPADAIGAAATPVPGKLLLPTPPGTAEPESPREVYVFRATESAPAVTVVVGVASASETQFVVFAVLGRGLLTASVQP